MTVSAAATVGTRAKAKLPQLAPGDTVRVASRIKEGDKERSQTMEGVVIRVRPGGPGANFTVRRVSYGVGFERTFPFASPLLEKVDVVRHGKVRRAKLYYLRSLGGKAARLKERRALRGVEARQLISETPAEEAPEAVDPQAAAPQAQEGQA